MIKLDNGEELLTVYEVAKLVNRHYTSVYQIVDRGLKVFDDYNDEFVKEHGFPRGKLILRSNALNFMRRQQLSR